MHPEPDPLFDTLWVHVFEEDSPAGAVFRPETADIPLSRRPRRRLRLKQDGTAVLMEGGPDDRPVGRPGRWTEEAGAIVVRDAAGETRLRIVQRSADRLVVTFVPEES